MDTIPLHPHDPRDNGPAAPASGNRSAHEDDRSGIAGSIAETAMEPASEPRTPAKLPGLIAIRAFAALGVVLLHVCVPYLQNPMPGLVWPITDATNFFLDCLFWSVEVVVMPIFLFVAGFLVWRSLHRGGPGRLVQNRARRLLVPLAFAMLVILPLEPFIWVLGFVSEGLVPAAKLRSLKLEGELERNFWGLSHLWFLPYLFLYIVVVAVGAKAAQRFALVKRSLSGLMSRPVVVPLLLIAIASSVLMLRPEVVWGFQHAFLPVPSKWVFCGCFFLGGLRLGARDQELSELARHARRLIPVALLLMAAAVMLGRWHLSLPTTESSQRQAAGYALAILTASGAWVATMAVMSIAVLMRDRVSKPIEYLAEASFWIYLIHHPLLGLIHIDLKWLLPSVSPAAKAAMSFALVSGLCLLSYEALIRHSRFGQWIGLSAKETNQPASPRVEQIPDVIAMPDVEHPQQEERRAA